MVKGHDRYFFDLAKGKVSIGNFQTVCNTTSANNINVSIPDNNTNGVSTTINVTDNITISDINININIAHTFIHDLTIKVTSPSGTEVTLFERNCHSQDNIIATFDDQGSNMNCNNIQGHIKPVGSLSDFNGENTQGTWTLWVSDSEIGDNGVIVGWGVEACYVSGAAINSNSISGLNIWPNPAHQQVNISFESNTKNDINISIFDISGRKVFGKTYNNTNTEFNQNINTSHLSKGLYLINVEDGNRKSTQKLLIK